MMENQDLITDEIVKVEHKMDKCVSMIQPADADGNNVYSPNMLNSTNPENEAVQSCDKKVHYEERYVSVGNEAHECDEVIADKMIEEHKKMNMEVNSKRIRRSNRLSVNDKKENLKTTISGKVLKQKKTTKKSNKMAQTTIPNEVLAMLYKKFEPQRYENTMLPPFRYIMPNNANNALQYIPYRIAKQEESHYNLNNNRNMLQYPDYNNLRSEKQPILMNPNSWPIVSKSGHNFINNNTQNQVEQSGFINDKQYHNSYTADYNLKQSENPYFQPSIKSTDSQKLLGMENKVFHCSCNVCTSNMWNNMHACGEVFPKMNNAFQQIVNNNTLSYIPLAATSNNAWNTTVGSFNYFPPNYQPLQADYNFKRLFYSGFNTINNATNNGYNVMARRNIMSPLNNWNTHINHLTIPCNNNTNIALNASVPSEPLSSSSLYTGNTSTQFSNYYNKDLAKVNMSVDQYKEKDHFNPSAISAFENSVPTDMHGLDSESTNTLSHDTSNGNDIIYDITNFVPETNTANTSEESQSYSYIKEMDKNWSSNISNI
ncbi:putative uncharacterized protein DDB_G0282133 [Camponotus floridanus]|uniref:putative uncharacterized protein DDB_G0282133 n=1 Tax=Camponotus floridanus TaxID=104421 RepID=UPI00059B91C3|nr:putative uncharacterized protein DDB_G0282133 [Camponotus floridanus]